MKHAFFWIGLIILDATVISLTNMGGQMNEGQEVLLGLGLLINFSAISFYIGYMFAKYKYSYKATKDMINNNTNQ